MLILDLSSAVLTLDIWYFPLEGNQCWYMENCMVEDKKLKYIKFFIYKIYLPDGEIKE